jgi:2-dehydropantoate 2-reductase
MVAIPEIRRLMTDVVDEVVVVAQKKGIRLPDNMLAVTFHLAEVMPRTTSSTAQDIARGRRTEIEHLNGYVAREGERLGIATPVNRALNALIKLMEQASTIRERR